MLPQKQVDSQPDITHGIQYLQPGSGETHQRAPGEHLRAGVGFFVGAGPRAGRWRSDVETAIQGNPSGCPSRSQWDAIYPKKSTFER